MVSLNEFIDPDLSAADVQHSNGYANAAGGAGAGGLSMEQRRQALRQPRTVGSYQHSHLGRRHNALKARAVDQSKGRAYDASSDRFTDKAKVAGRRKAGANDATQIDKSVSRRQNFVEPPKRGYNPYA